MSLFKEGGVFGGRKAKRQISTRQYLRAVPYRNEAMRLEDQPGGELLAVIPMQRPKYLIPPLSWVIPYSAHRRVQLDAVGAEVLKLCDGDRTIEQIIETFAARHRLSFREAQLAVTEFLRQLTQRGIVAIVGLKESDEP